MRKCLLLLRPRRGAAGLCLFCLTGVLAMAAAPARGDEQAPPADAKQRRERVAELIYELKRLPERVEYDWLDEVVEQLVEIGHPAVPQMIDALHDTGPTRTYVVRSAAKALGAIGDPRAVPALVALLDDDARGVPDAAASALAKIGRAAVEPLLASLPTARSQARALAAEALGEIGDRRAVPPLLELLSDPHALVRGRAARALGRLGDRRAVDPLLAALHGEPGWCRSAAAIALGEIGDPAAVAPLIAALDDHDEGEVVDAAAAEALGKLGDKAAFEPLIKVLRGDRWRASLQAARSLGEIGDGRAVMPLLESYVSHLVGSTSGGGGAGGVSAPDPYPAAAIEALAKIGSRDVDALATALKDEDAAIRRLAARALGAAGNRRAMEPLLAALDDEQPDVTAAAALSLCQLGEPRGVEACLAPLRGQESGPYSNLGQALGKCGKPVVEPLIKALDDDSRLVCCAAAIALQEIGDRRAAEALKKAFRDPRSEQTVLRPTVIKTFAKWADPADRAFLRTVAASDDDQALYAAAILAGFGDSEAFQPLVDGLDDKYDYRQSAAIRGLGLLQDARALEPLTAMLQGPLRTTAAKAIGEIGGADAVKILIDGLDSMNGRKEVVAALKTIGEPAVKPLIAALQDERMYVRCGAAEALRALGDKRAVPALIEALDDEFWWVPMRAAAALATIRDPRAIEPLAARLSDRYVRKALLDFGPAAFDAVLKRLEQGDDATRASAATILGWYGDNRAVPLLIAALDDQPVRGNATAALGWIGDPRAVESLVTTLEDGNVGIAHDPVREALAAIGTPAVKLTMFALRHGSPGARLRAVWTLLQLHDRQSVDALAEAIADVEEDAAVRSIAAQALGAIEDARAVAPLLDALSDSNPQIRAAAAEALGRICDPQAAAGLEALLARETDEDVRRKAKDALRQLPAQK